MAMRMWTQEETRSLISHYKTYPELWDTTHPDYKCRKKKMEASEKLAVIFNATPAEINRKLHNIRTQFHNERRKLKRMRSDQVGARRYHTSTWEYFSSLTFLLNSESESSDMKEIPLVSPMVNKSLIAQHSIITPYAIINPNQQRNGTVIPRPQEEVRDPVTSKLLKSENDEVTFGNFVASAIRNLRSEVRRRQLKRKIQQAILEIEELDEADQLLSHPSAADAAKVHSPWDTGSEKKETGWPSPEVKIEYDEVAFFIQSKVTKFHYARAEKYLAAALSENPAIKPGYAHASGTSRGRFAVARESGFSLDFSVVERRLLRYVVSNFRLPHKFHLESRLNTMQRRTWSEEETESLISFYRAHKELWLNRRTRGYDRAKRAATHRKLAHIFKTTPTEIDKKLKSLKCGFLNELRKMNLGNGYITTWEHYPSLKFLKNRNSKSPTRASSVETPNLDQSQPQPSNTINPNSITSNSSTAESTPQKSTLEDQANSKPSKSEDEEVFGNFVAAAIRNLRSEARRRELKRKIQRAIIETEELDEADQSGVFSPPSPITNTTNGTLDIESSPPEVKMEFEHNFAL
ncbi:uncharacterized protein LOC123307174 [Coccinella septempunctata]|uniref:uncharacterized protein LOC123307174 n=1 Tax=Coccinella septempunctata TaxID=41139 RepID=UPI001D0851E9|nr:uncharacterized protein LOC123307174 [Coccinella septempunctata]